MKSGTWFNAITSILLLSERVATHVNKILLGSVAEGVFRETTCPVLTVGPQVGPSSSSLNLRQILYSTNLREESHGALDYAISLTRQYRAQLTLLHIVEQDEPKSSNDQWLKPDYELLRQLVLDEDLSIEPRFRIEVTKNTPARILRVAEEIAADLIVMDVRPEEPWATHLLDRAYEIISFSSCPVLTVRTRAGIGLQER
jgi:nucleotide-binding universal stress UspA family protein